MYRLLIIDDERIARESVYELLATQNDLELELLTADSAVGAISIMETERVDIAVMDINMPQVTGLELYGIVRKKWPQCKVVFLTGYSEFDYVYKVHKHAKYILKADREENLVEAVRESIREIENEMIITHAADITSEHKRKAGSYRANVFMNELIEGYTDVGIVDNALLADMNITLDIGQKVYPLLAWCKDIVTVSFEQRQNIIEKVTMLLGKYFAKEMNCVITIYKRAHFFLLIQPKEVLAESAEIRRLSGLCSLFQSALQLNVATTAAMLIPDVSMNFIEAIRSFGLFYDAILRVETGDTHVFSYKNAEPAHEISGQSKQEILQSVLNLEYSFETANRDEIVKAIRTVRNYAQGVTNINDLFFLGVYLNINTMILKMIQQYGIEEKQVQQLGITGLYNVMEYRSWEHVFSRLEGIVQKVIDLHEKSRGEQQEGLVIMTKRYIRGHLNEGLSLMEIADHFHFSPEYLLRVFKKEEGVTILQYINDLKLKRAKELLRNPDLQVKDIAQALGFGSSTYFIRFFKSKTGTSPQAYRQEKKEEI